MTSRKQALLERIEATAEAHEQSCECLTCRAAAGVGDARKELLSELL